MSLSQSSVQTDATVGPNIAKFSRPADDPSEVDFGALIRSADAARDRNLWREAANAYRAALDLDPNAAPIWVQYGNMLKEAAELAEAGRAYETALRLQPDSADTYLQLGHLMKLSNRMYPAVEMYAKALEIEPNLADAAKELAFLGAGDRASAIVGRVTAASEHTPLIYIDVSDLFHFFETNPTPTGIQRIVIGFAEAALRRDDRSVAICAVDQNACEWRLVDAGQFMRLLSLSRKTATAAEPSWQSATAEMTRYVKAAPPVRFAPGSVVVAPGSPWAVKYYLAAIRKAKRESGIRYVAFVHDLVPLMFPEYCESVRPEDYTRWLTTVAGSADLLVANSENTKRDLIRILAELRAPQVRGEVVTPNGLLNRPGPEADTATAPVKLPADYALMVGTLEPRKNHLLVLTAWRQLISELGPDRVPSLVLVGKYGWGCDDTKRFLDKTEFLGGKVLVLEDVCDVMLPSLYRGARFTIYNSHYEGWGLPVTESLAFGKIPVVARNSGLLESGGDQAVFFDTNSVPSLTAAVRPLLDRNTLNELESKMDLSRAVRRWDDVLEDLIAITNTVPAPPHFSTEKFGAAIKLGTLCLAGGGRARRLSGQGPVFDAAELEHLGVVESMMTPSDWHPPEEWGAWSRAKEFEFSVALAEWDLGRENNEDLSPPLTLYLHVLGHRESSRSRWAVDNVHFPELVLEPNEQRLLRVTIPGPAQKAGRLCIRCVQENLCDLSKHHPLDDRIVGVGLMSLMLCREDDLVSRVNMLEHFSGCIRMETVSPIVAA